MLVALCELGVGLCTEQFGQEGLAFFGEGGGYGDLFLWMGRGPKGEFEGMQKMPKRVYLTIQCIAQNGEAEVAQVDADLVAATGMGNDAQKGMLRRSGKDRDVRVSVECLFVVHFLGSHGYAHFGTAMLPWQKGKAHVKRITRWGPDTQREVFLFYKAV